MPLDSFNELLAKKERCCKELKDYLDKFIAGGETTNIWGVEIAGRIEGYLASMREIDGRLAVVERTGTQDCADSINKSLDSIEGSLRTIMGQIKILQMRFSAAKSLLREELKSVRGSNGVVNYLHGQLAAISETIEG